MWSWTDPVREVLQVFLNRICAPYIENLDIDGLNYGLTSGELALKGLRLKRSALDKFRLPVDVREGHLGKLTVSIPWAHLSSKPVEILIEDIYLLVTPATNTKVDPEDDERRAHAVKAERLKSSELFSMREQTEQSAEAEGFIGSLVTKIINNVQITVKNIHIRYEDDISCPGHPFALGLTLAGFMAKSTDSNWQPAFIESTSESIRKLVRLESLAVYFDTDSASIAGLSVEKALAKFTSLIASGTRSADHQFILKPVTGEGRITLSKAMDKQTPKTDVRLLFDEIGFTLDDYQYRDIISLIDMYHFYLRRYKYRVYAPDQAALDANRPRALLQFAGKTILHEIHEKHRKTTWKYIKKVGECRRSYMTLFRKRITTQLAREDQQSLDELERKLSFEDIKLYRFLVRRQIRQDIKSGKLQKGQGLEVKSSPSSSGGWGIGWLLGYGSSGHSEEAESVSTSNIWNMTDEQQKELYKAVDYDQEAVTNESDEQPPDSLKLHVSTKLERGSFSLKSNSYDGKTTDIISLVFDDFAADIVQRPDNFEGTLTLGGFRVYDGTTLDSAYPQIVRVKGKHIRDLSTENRDTSGNPRRETAEDNFLFYLKFENKPLDQRADSALTARLRYMEIIYHKGYVEAIYQFFRPPESQLESLDALLGVASDTFDGLRQETRAGLEYALDTHKTIDLKMDLQAPIIIVPENVSSEHSPHLVLDAGHIAIESELAAKNARLELDEKLKKVYEPEDYKRLEAHMYDRFSLKFEAAQFLLGPDLNSCLNALDSSNEQASLHIVEQINLDLLMQKSILPSRARLPSVIKVPRIKISGRLPTLQVNVSDTKYKTLMRFIDVAIPKFGTSSPKSGALSTARDSHPIPPGTFRLPSTLFRQGSKAEYQIEDDTTDEEEGEEEEFVDAEDGPRAIDGSQEIFQLDFQVDVLRTLVSKSNPSGGEVALGNLQLECFRLTCAAEDLKLTVNITLRSLNMALEQVGGKQMSLVSSGERETTTSYKDLMTITYYRVQAEHPDFLVVHEGSNQDVKISLSTFIFHAAPEPVITLYDFIMSTFVPEKSITPSSPHVRKDNPLGAREDQHGPVPSPNKMRVAVDLASVQVLFINDFSRLATLALSTAGVSIKIRGNTLRLSVTLGKLSLTDDSDLETRSASFKQILTIEGDNLANIGYQTFDSQDSNTFRGFNSAVTLKSGALKITFLEEPLKELFKFLVKFAKLKSLYDAAASAAANRASEIQQMQFDVSIESPILVFPHKPTESNDNFTMKLGQIAARNSYENSLTKIAASLRGVQLTSEAYYENELSRLKIIDDVEIMIDIQQTSGIDHRTDPRSPDTQVTVNVSDVKLHLTQFQYCFLVDLARSLSSVWSIPPEPEVASQPSPTMQHILQPPPLKTGPSLTPADLQPEIEVVTVADGAKYWTSLDMRLKVKVVKLHLYDEYAREESTLKDRGIVRFALSDTTLRYTSLSNGAAEAELVLRSFTMSNTRAGMTKFREIIPAAQHNRNQFMVLYTTSGGGLPSSLAVITVDSPRFIFAVEPVFALLDFFSSAFTQDNTTVGGSPSISGAAKRDSNAQTKQGDGIDFRVDLHDVTISVLETDTMADTQSIQLSIKQVSISQQTILALTVNRLGMSLVRMDKPAETVRFLDDLDITISADNRNLAAQQMLSIETTVQPVVFRVSYRDINLITTIFNKAIELSTKSKSSMDSNNRQSSGGDVLTGASKSSRSLSKIPFSKPASFRAPRIITSKERLKGKFDGFRLILIGDVHELPILHCSTKPFELVVKDWSADLQASLSVATSIDFWNLSNSHWEPLIDPWIYSINLGKQGSSGGIVVTLSSKERLDINISTTLIDLVLSTLKVWNKEGDRVLRRARGGDAPYRIRNRTGGSLLVWSDVDGTAGKNDPAITIRDGETIDWRFDDWKTMREHVSTTGRNSLGVQYIGKPWDELRSLYVDREGEYTYTLRPRTQKVSSRMLCEVSVKDNVKIVTLRSTYKVMNNTLYPLELMLLDNSGRPAYAMEKLAPGDDYAIPIDAVTDTRITLRPDQGFGYTWSGSLQWEDLMTRPAQVIVCSHSQSNEPAWRLQAWAQYDNNDPVARKYPKITLRLRAPIELENLLPYNIQYRIFDKQLDQNWSSYLRQGGLMPVHSVELQHLVMLNVRIQDTCFISSDWSIINANANADLEVERQLTLRDPVGRKLDLRLNYVRHDDSGGAFKVQIYCPYIIVNKTGMPFQIRSLRSNRAGVPQEVAGVNNPEELAKPTPFMLSHSHLKGHEFVLRVGESAWTQTLSFEAPSAEAALSLAAPGHTESHIGISWTEGKGKYKLSKVITLAPRFLVKNNLREPLQFREKGMPPSERSLLQPGARSALQFTRRSQEKLLTVAYSGLNTRWSAPINIQDIGTVHFRLYPPGESFQDPHLVRADVAVEGGTVHITINAEDGPWPFVIDNNSDYDISFCQTDEFGDGAKPDSSLYVMHRVNRHSSANYAWDCPSAREKQLLLTINDRGRKIDIMEIGNLPPFKFPYEQGSRTVSLDIRAEGPSQILDISNYQEEFSLYKPKRKGIGTMSRQDTIGSASENFEAVTEDEIPNLNLQLDLAGVGISLVNRKMVEVVYMSLRRLNLVYTRTETAQAVTLSCSGVQIDNQLHEAIYPVALQQTPLPNNKEMTVPPPTIQASVIFLNDQEHGVLFVKYASVLLQSLTVRLDEDFLLTLFDMTKLQSMSWEEDQQEVLIEHPMDIPEPAGTVGGQSIYFEVLELQPIKLLVSFMTTQRVNADEKINTSNPFALVLRTLLNFLGNVNDAPFKLNALAFKDLHQTLPDLEQRILYHYRQEVTRQALRMMGSADFIGNPVGLFENISSGMVDAFYEPWAGVVVHGLNKEFGIGVVKGVSSLIKKSVFGVSDSFSKVTSSIGKGIATATFDVEWDNKRRLAQRRNKPRHIIDGVAAGAEAFATSVGSGIEGLVMKPIEGAQTNGAGGFFKGIGKGVVGLVTKPAVGFLDLASNVGAGVRNTTTVFDNPARDRVRLPRHIPADGVLTSYSKRDALGQFLMKDLEQGLSPLTIEPHVRDRGATGSYRSEVYVAHVDIPGGDNVVMLTMTRVLSFWSTKLRLDWDMPFTYVQGVNIEDNGILFQDKAGKDRDRFIYIADPGSKSWFFSQIEQVVKAYNARRRVELRPK